MKRFFLIIFLIIAPITSAQENWGPAEYIDSENWWDLDCGGDMGYGFLRPSISSNDSLLFMEFMCFDTAGVAFMHYEDGEWRDLTTLPPEIQNLNPGSPFFTDHNDTILYFTSSNYDEGYGLSDLWAVRFNDGNWSQPWNLGPVINTAGYETSASTSDEEDRLYFIRDRIIMYSDIIDGEFTEPVELPEAINSQLWEFDPRISRDGSRLYFTRGDEDPWGPIYMLYSSFSDGTWQQPVELNGNINFFGGDCAFMPDFSCAPSFSMDGTKMYFSHFVHLQPWCEPNFRIAVSHLITDISPDDPTVPESFYVSAYPNPFNSKIKITVGGDMGLVDEISIFNITGRRVENVPVEKEIVWDGTNESGKPLSSGIYFIKVGTGTASILKKITLLR